MLLLGEKAPMMLQQQLERMPPPARARRLKTPLQERLSGLEELMRESTYILVILILPTRRLGLL